MALSNLVGLFNIKKNPDTGSTISIPVTNPLSLDNKKQDETYVYYGKRICGNVTASLSVLNPFLLKVYNGEKQRQVSDTKLQQDKRDQLSKELSDVEGKIQSELTRKNNSIVKQDELRSKLADLKMELIEAKNKNGQINKMARVKLWIGCIILLIMTVYLFIFYSSTFYSAFFKDFAQGNAPIEVGVAMFDAKALPNAAHTGLGELVFIICAPIIFMGLGYCLHYFMEGKSSSKYFKAGSILLVTVAFDCILAYLIAKKIYEIEIITSWEEMPPFGIGIAGMDPNFWAVIFCGFIVYLIWGIIFDMVMTAYENLRSNKNEIDKVLTKIAEVNLQISKQQQVITDMDCKINGLQADRDSLQQKLTQEVFYDTQVIKTSLSDFFAGWMSIMNQYSTPQQQSTATQIYSNTIAQLF